MAGLSVSSEIVGALVGSAVLLAALLYLKTLQGAPRGLGWWLAAFGVHVALYFIYLLGGLVPADIVAPRAVTFVAESLQALVGIFLLAGTAEFATRKVSRGWVACACLAILAWTAYATFVWDDFLWRTLPIYGAAGLALAVAGIMLLRLPAGRNWAYRLTGGSFLLWGLHKFDYPWLRPIDWFAPYGFVLAQTLALTSAMGLIVIATERLRGVALLASARHEIGREYQSVINRLLRISLETIPLREQLARSLAVILSAPDCTTGGGGGVFLFRKARLELACGRDLDPAVAAWDGRSLPAYPRENCPGECRVGEVWSGEDDAWPTHPDYRVEPLVSDGECLGLLAVREGTGRGASAEAAEFLRAGADILAGMVVRRRAEAALERHRRLLIEAQRLAHLGSWQHDLSAGSMSTAWSDEVYRILGHEPGAIEPGFAAFLAQVHEKDRGRVERAMRAAIDSGDYSSDHRVVRPDGSVRYVSERAEVLRDEAGQARRVLGTIQDVSEAKAAERELLLAKEQAEAANQAKSAFLATMSHELRTPLNAVIGFAQIIEQERFGPHGSARYRDYAQHIRESGEHLLSVISDILDISKIESGELVLDERELDCVALIDRTCGLLLDKAQRSGLTLTRRLAKGLPRLHADERAVKQILLNLLSNAIKFTPAGGEVAVEAKLVEGALELSVGDNGIGVAAADHERIFRPFVQADDQLSRRYEGTGLGLPLVRSLADLHGACLEFESAPGAGTKVSIRFAAERLRAPAA